jgi:hypothetical protein
MKSLKAITHEEKVYTVTANAVTVDLGSCNQSKVDLSSATSNVTITFTLPSNGVSVGSMLIVPDDASRALTYVVTGGTAIWVGDEFAVSVAGEQAQLISWRTSGTNVYLAHVGATTTGTSSFAHGVCQGRLTTESGVPISTSDRTGTNASVIYFTPYDGNRVSLYSGSEWIEYAFTERSLALSGLTTDAVYDVFLYDNSGTLTLELSTAWTNSTTRANALTTQDGILVKSGATTRRYLGTFKAVNATQTKDTEASRWLANYYNVVQRLMRSAASNSTYSYNSSTTRQINADAAMAVNFVVARPLSVYCEVFNGSNNGAVGFTFGMGLDTTTAFTVSFRAVSGSYVQHKIDTYLAAVPGYHYLAGLENTDGDITFVEARREVRGSIWN